jgi:uncharacterized protein (TIGR03118 family)
MRHSTRNLQHTVLEGKHKRRSRRRRPAVDGLEERALLSAAHDLAVHKHFAVPDDNTANDYEVINLVSNIRKMALKTDRSLVNPWDVNFPQRPKTYPPVWVSDQGTNVATIYQISPPHASRIVKLPLTVTIPTLPTASGVIGMTGPTGVVQDPTNSFLMPRPRRNRVAPAKDISDTTPPRGAPAPVLANRVPAEYIFATLQGTIEGYYPGPHGDNTSAEIVVINNPSTTSYTGLATGTFGGQHYIYAANDLASPGIDVYDDYFQRPSPPLPGNFVDPCLPAGFTPYSVRDLNNDLFVTYRGPEFIGGAIAEFSNGGTFMQQIACDTTSSGNLQTPSGLAVISAGFGEFNTDLLVSNFSSGQIDAYTFSGQFLGKLLDPNGAPITIPWLRSIHFGPGLGSSVPKAALLFTAGTDGTPGLYGMIRPVT